MNRALIILIALFSIASCTKEAAQNIVPSSDEVTFTTSNSLTRATEDKSSWAEDDRIGVYVMDSGNTLQKYNIEYKATSGTPDTSFSAAGDDKAYFLGYDIKTSFTVYYPYDEDITDENVTIELDTKQNDLLISGVVSQAQSSSQSVALSFTHALTMVEIALQTSLEFSSLDNLKLYITDSYSNGTHNLIDSKTTLGTNKHQLNMTVTESTSTTDDSQTAYTANVLVMPYDYTEFGEKITVYFEVNGTAYCKEISPKWEAGMKYTYSATLGDNTINFCLSNIADWNDNEDSTPDTAIADIILKDQKYYISSGKGLAAFRDLVNGAGYTSGASYWGFEASEFSSKHPSIDGILTCDVDLSGVCGQSLGNWTPIGINATYDYAGTFDGGGYLVSGLYIVYGAQKALFGYLDPLGVIANIGVDGFVDCDADEQCYQVSGVIANNHGLVINCYNLATIYGYANVGGVAGLNEGYIANCYNQGTITSSSHNVGGIVGQNKKCVNVCYSSGGITGGGDRIGAIVGWDNSSESNSVTSGFYLENSTTYSIGSSSKTAGKLSATALQGYATTLTTNAASYNSDNSPAVSACSWKAVYGDYPALNFGVVAGTN